MSGSAARYICRPAMRGRLPLTLLIVLFGQILLAQTKSRSLPAVRTTVAPVIDGEINEAIWKTSPPATGFIEFQPTPGRIENEETRTEIHLLYDDVAIYVGGYCYEKRDSIITELVGRDRVGANDHVAVFFDTYHDRINATGFFVTALGEQYDARYYAAIANNSSDEGGSESFTEDDTWNAVYISRAQLHNDGWSFEMRIPYSALRFSKDSVQQWGLNFFRNRTKAGRKYTWNFFDPKVSGLVNQFGTWDKLAHIKPPLRLSFTPYFAAYSNHYPYNAQGVKNWTQSVNGGMDVKLGISQSFTLDMTLIPDFGQVQSDNRVLNLTPFEVKFDEYRTFFTEGTELFSKGDLFYSRRIGGTPLHYDDVRENLPAGQTVTKNPTESKLVNATKVSGRSTKGLGIGFLNAMSKPMFATVEDSNKHSYTLQTAPFTNYNIFVLDQSLKNNSSVSLINTNVLRDGADYDANVTAAVWNLNDKHNQYNSNGRFARSHKGGANGYKENGFAYDFSAGKSGGKFLYRFFQSMASDQYDQNDLGILFNNNYLTSGLEFKYRWLEPSHWRNKFVVNLKGLYTQRYKPWDYQQAEMSGWGEVQLKNLWTVGAWASIWPYQYDYYEPRISGMKFYRAASHAMGGWVGTNQAKRYNVVVQTFWRRQGLFNGLGGDIEVEQSFRVNNAFSVRLSTFAQPRYNQAGFTLLDSTNQPVFARRDRRTYDNVLNLKYNFNTRMGLNLRIRHYWSKVWNKAFYDLATNGRLQPKTGYAGPVGQNYNFFNVDMVYTWQVAPGSFFNLVWKNAVSTADEIVVDDYIRNVRNVVQSPALNSLSVKLIYYLDAIDFRVRKKK